MKTAATEKYAKLWNRVLTLDDNSARGLLCYLMGYCMHNEHFLKGVASGLPLYSTTKEEAEKEG